MPNNAENSLFFRYAKKFSMSTPIFFLSTQNWNALQNSERGNANHEKKALKKHAGTRNAEREEEMQERGHASREGPAGTRAQLCKWGKVFAKKAVLRLYF